MALINNQQPVVGEIIDQAFRRGARFTSGQMTGIVLNAIAIAHLLQHLQVVGGALLQSLSFQQLAFGLQELQSVFELMADILHRRIQTILRRYKVLGRVDVDGFKTLQDFAGGGVDVADRLHLITEQLHPN